MSKTRKRDIFFAALEGYAEGLALQAEKDRERHLLAREMAKEIVREQNRQDDGNAEARRVTDEGRGDSIDLTV